MRNSESKFDLGEITVSLFARFALERAGQKAEEFLNMHKKGCWGDITAEEKQQNEKNIEINNGKILSAYITTFNEALWVITDLSENKTILILPREYDRTFED